MSEAVGRGDSSGPSGRKRSRGDDIYKVTADQVRSALEAKVREYNGVIEGMSKKLAESKQASEKRVAELTSQLKANEGAAAARIEALAAETADLENQLKTKTLTETEAAKIIASLEPQIQSGKDMISKLDQEADDLFTALKTCQTGMSKLDAYVRDMKVKVPAGLAGGAASPTRHTAMSGIQRLLGLSW